MERRSRALPWEISHCAEHEEPNRRKGVRVARRDADEKAEKLERGGRIGGGTAERTGAGRQTAYGTWRASRRRGSWTHGGGAAS